jgi:hypothetical protein
VTAFHSSVEPVLRRLRAAYPHTPFLALGQTIWWDEPMKAVLMRMLAELGLGGDFVLGVHDTDYFAKVRVRRAGQPRFALLPHNDGSTKDLWSAAGEISRLFGSETFPTRADFVCRGVPFKRLVSSQPDEAQRFIDEVTEAWGWRGLAYTGRRDLIVRYLSLKDLGEAIEQLLRWGFEGTLESISSDCCRRHAADIAQQLLERVAEYRATHPDARLTDLYQALFPELFALLLGHPPSGAAVTGTGSLLQFNAATCGLPRFAFVELFLNPATRSLAVDAYNHAVHGTEMYTLDRFGLGALPFDLVTPEHGRGTLRVTLRALHIEARTPIRIRLKRPVESVSQLAEVISGELGDNCALVGKAVALISMLAREFIFVFNEEGSGYVTRTRAMNDYLQSHGVEVPVHPILRLRYGTWDALEGAETLLRLPEHLEQGFGKAEIDAGEFGAKWQRVVHDQGVLLDRLGAMRKPRELLRFLAERNPVDWGDCEEIYNRCKSALVDLRRRALAIQERVNSLYAEIQGIREEIRSTERAMSQHFRSIVEWTAEAMATRADFAARLQRLNQRRRQVLAEVAELKRQRLELERGDDAAPHRAELARIELAANLERLRLVRNAILTRSSLTHTQHRPTAWWIPMVDPSGAWFNRIAATTEVYLQPLVSQGSAYNNL